MRELILKMSLSIDGFVGNPDGGVKWLFDKDPEATAWTVETVWNASLHIMGSRTFHDMAAYWPTSTEVYALPMNQIPKAVFSKQPLPILEGVRGLGGANLSAKRTLERFPFRWNRARTVVTCPIGPPARFHQSGNARTGDICCSRHIPSGRFPAGRNMF